MDKPQIPDAPGLAWRPRKNGWAAVWLARQDLAKNGFKPSTAQLGIFTAPPTPDEEHQVRAACVRLQKEMYAFQEGRPKVFGGTLAALFKEYQIDKDSPYKAMRYRPRLRVDALMKRIATKYGHLRLAEIGARDFKEIYESFRWPKGKDGAELKTTAHAIMTVMRMAFSFGLTFEVEKTPRDRISECARLRTILGEMKFQTPDARDESMTLRQCEDIITAAHRMGLHSIALAQALQFDLRCRQKDIVGEWVPESEPGISVIPPRKGWKWLRGLRWEEISSTLMLDHPISKSRTGKHLQRDLKIYPMVMAEFERVPLENRVGPVVISERTGRPWKQNSFRQRWRDVARAAGVPDEIWNMDNRASGITETIEATAGNIEAARKEAEHSDIKTTLRYSRRRMESAKQVTAAVLDFRAKNRD